ncbi:hypothetical protein DFH27DRAFT_90563 [Peziza echinospora]|nr:hypothetical protein DFH27DRAFT_90563 [Peziza echinospora]
MIAAAGTRGSIIDRILGAHSHPIVTGRIITILVSGYSKYSAYKYDENDLISTTKTLLSKSPIHTETVVLDIIGTARNSASLQAMKALEPEISLDINPSMALVSLLKWDQGFSHEFLKWHREKFPEYIAPEMIYHTAAGYGDCVDYLRFIIDLNPSKSSMIENIILMLRGDLLPGPETLRFAFTKLKTGEPTTKITSGMLAAVARKVRSESDLQILLDATSRLPADIITHKVLEAAAENESGCAIHLLRVLLQLADNLSLTKDIARNVIQSEINLVLSNYSDTEKESKRKDAREELSSLFHNFQEFPAIYKIAGTLSDFNSQYIILPETKVQAIIYTLITDKELEGSIAKPGLLHDFGMTQYTALKTFLDKDPETPITEKVVRAARRLLNPYSFELIRKRDPYLPLNERIIFSSLQKISSLTKRKTALADHLSKDGSEADFLFQSERFFVEAVKSWGYKEPYIKRFFFNGDGSVRQGIITEDVLLAAAGSDRVKEKDLLAFLDQVRPMTKSTEFLVAITDRMKRPNDILSNAIEFLRNRGEDVLTEGFLESYSKELSSASDSDGSELVYSFGPWIDSINPTIITESVMACAADNTSQGLQLLEKFIEINPNAPITANVLVKAVASLEYHGWPNASHHGKVLRYLLKVVEERGARTEEIVQELITEKVLLAVAGSGSDTAENELMLKYLLKTYPETPVTGKLFLKAVRKGLTSDTLRYLLDKIQEPISDGTLEKCLLAVVRTKDTKALGIILDQAPQISISSIISEKVLISAAKRADDVHLMDLLLSKYPGELITEPVFLAAAQNDDPSILQYLLYKLPSTRITSAILVAGAKNMTWRTIKTLLSFQPGPSQISGDVLIAAAQSENPYIIESILKSGLVEVNAITESVLLAAANNQWAGGSVMETLLKWTFEQSRPSRITSSVMVSAAKSSNRAMMEVLLAKNPVVEEEVFIAAAGNFSERNMLLLLAKCPDMVITENILVVAVGNVNYYVTKHLLSLQSSRLDSSIITENVLVTAARNSRVKVLLWMFIERAERDGRKLDIRENVLREVARNRFTGAEIILEELLEHSNTGLLTTTTITISLLEAAASNSSPRGEAIYKFLLSKSSAPALKIPDVAMKKILLSAAKTGNWRTLRYLLTQNIHFMTDTGFLQELIISAAGGAESENLGYLMSVYDDSLPVLKEMVDAARGNTDKKVGQRMVRWLTERDGALRCYITQPEKEQANDIDEDGEDWDDEQEKKEMKLEMEKEKKRESEEEVVGRSRWIRCYFDINL